MPVKGWDDEVLRPAVVLKGRMHKEGAQQHCQGEEGPSPPVERVRRQGEGGGGGGLEGVRQGRGLSASGPRGG